MNYRYTIKVLGDPKFYNNAVVFATEAEAVSAAICKATLWTLAEDWQVEETSDPANYGFEDGQLVPLKENA